MLLNTKGITFKDVKYSWLCADFELHIFFNEKKIGYFSEQGGLCANFKLKNADGVEFCFHSHRNKTHQISEFKKAIKQGYNIFTSF